MTTSYTPRWADEREANWKAYQRTTTGWRRRSTLSVDSESIHDSESSTSEEQSSEDQDDAEAVPAAAEDADDDFQHEEIELVSPPDTNHGSTLPRTRSSTSAAVSAMALVSIPEEERCLICHQRPMTGCIIHGKYAHVYSCYTCAKKLERANEACLVCGRAIDSVVNKLPLSQASRRRIQAAQSSSS